MKTRLLHETRVGGYEDGEDDAMDYRETEAAEDAKKADGAKCTALRIPRPPIFTGRED